MAASKVRGAEGHLELLLYSLCVLHGAVFPISPPFPSSAVLDIAFAGCVLRYVSSGKWLLNSPSRLEMGVCLCYCLLGCVLLRLMA